MNMSRLVGSTLFIVLAVTGCASGGNGGASPAAPAAPAAYPAPAAAPAALAAYPAPAAAPAAPAALVALTGPRLTMATRLAMPWGLAFLPDGTALITLRDRAAVLHLATRGRPVSVGRVPWVVPGGEGGLLGIAVSPRFASDRQVFFYLTSAVDNRVIRMTYNGAALRKATVIVRGIPKAGIHNGGRLAFGPDGYLYISTGDAGRRPVAQDRRSLGGKILRVTTTGAAAPGNPIPGSRIWSLGHRNVQGMAWSRTGAMYASELGANTWDELNRILPGRNYGWPIVEGIARRPGFVNPIRQWPTADASPSGIAIGRDGAVYMAALRGQSLWRIPLDSRGRAGTPQRFYQGTFGRLRTVVAAPNGRLWVVTSNSNVSPRRGDDRIIAFRLPLR